jgi:GMP synthase PP-ATPase subunit
MGYLDREPYPGQGSCGITGDERVHEQAMALRVVEHIDFTTAD